MAIVIDEICIKKSWKKCHIKNFVEQNINNIKISMFINFSGLHLFSAVERCLTKDVKLQLEVSAKS